MSLGCSLEMTWQLGNLGCTHWEGASKLLFFCSSTIRHHLFCFPHTSVSPYWHILLSPVAAAVQDITSRLRTEKSGARLPAVQEIISFFKESRRAVWPTNPPIHLGSNVTLSSGDEQSAWVLTSSIRCQMWECVGLPPRHCTPGTATSFNGVHLAYKGGVPLQARCGPEGSRRFRLPDFHDIRHVKVVRSSASRTDCL